MLYVPPYWLARLESHTGAVGLDVLSPSEEQLRLMEASMQLVPLPEAETEEERVVAAQVTIYFIYIYSMCVYIYTYMHIFALSTCCDYHLQTARSAKQI